MFDTLSDRLTQVFSSLRGRGRLSAADIDATCREIRIALLEADVALPVVRQFIARVKERASGEEVSAALNPAQQVIKIVNEELIGILGGEERRLRFAKVPPTVIMLAGLQGSGKTTLAAKLALWLKGQGNTPMLVAADLQRPNAVQQLQVLGERAGVPVYAPFPGNGVGDPVAAARDSLEEARRRQQNMVIIDTAGRLGVDAEMMAQAVAIRDATQPDEILFVVDAMIGQDAVATAQAFLDGVGYDGVVLTKLDGDARGGAALSIVELTGRPIMFASSGEKLEDFDMFHPDRMASRILDLGDMLTLIEQAEKAFDADQTADLAGRLASGEGFTLEDFVEQLSMVRKLGPIGNILGMLPGAGKYREQLEQVNDKDLDRAEAIVRSMTPEERRNPKIINGSRRARIAKGSGVAIGEVSQLVTNFFEGQKQMKAMFSGGIPGMPPMPGLGAARRAAGQKARNKKGKKKGAAQRRPAARRRDRAWRRRPGRRGPRNPRRPRGRPGRGGRPRRPAWRRLAGRFPREPGRRAGQPAARAELPASGAGQHPGRVPRRQQAQEEVTLSPGRRAWLEHTFGTRTLTLGYLFSRLLADHLADVERPAEQAEPAHRVGHALQPEAIDTQGEPGEGHDGGRLGRHAKERLRGALDGGAVGVGHRLAPLQGAEERGRRLGILLLPGPGDGVAHDGEARRRALVQVGDLLRADLLPGGAQERLGQPGGLHLVVCERGDHLRERDRDEPDIRQ